MIKQGSGIKCLIKVLSVLLMAISLHSCGPEEYSSKKVQTEISFLIGSYAEQGQPGIYRLNFDTRTNKTTLEPLANTANPSYLAPAQDNKLLYAVNETGNGGVSIYQWSDALERLSFLDKLEGIAANPCHINISPDGSQLAIANYSSSDVQLFNIKGNTFEQVAKAIHKGKGPHDRQEAPHPHWVIWSPNGKFVYVVDLGIDQIKVYESTNDSLSAGSVAAQLNPADGPRHMVFHPFKDLAYVINELSNTVAVFNIDQSSGLLTEIQRLSSLPSDFKTHSQAAAIKLSPDNRFLYVSNRGANSIAAFALDNDGVLSYIHEQSTGGEWPRDFTISKDGEFLLVTNQNSNQISVLKRDTQSGRLQPSVLSIEVSQPTYISQM